MRRNNKSKKKHQNNLTYIFVYTLLRALSEATLISSGMNIRNVFNFPLNGNNFRYQLRLPIANFKTSAINFDGRLEMPVCVFANSSLEMKNTLKLIKKSMSVVFLY
jgi:hypothetical protein